MSRPEKPTVFVVDDDEMARDSLTVLLESHDFDVRSFESGKAFLNARDGVRGCLILDVHMPELSGLDLLRVLRHEGDLIPAILITGRRTAAAESEAKALGAIGLFDKPVTQGTLLGAVKAALDSLPD